MLSGEHSIVASGSSATNVERKTGALCAPQLAGSHAKENSVKIYDFQDEGMLHDTLLAKDVGLEGILNGIRAELKAGGKVLARVPNQGDRALILRSTLDELLGQKSSGSDVVAIPMAY